MKIACLVCGLLSAGANVESAADCARVNAEVDRELMARQLTTGELFIGTIVPSTHLSVTSHVAGRATAIAVTVGQKVRVGDSLVRILAPELVHHGEMLDLQVEEAEATVDKALAAADGMRDRAQRRRNNPALFSAEDRATAEEALREAAAEIRRTQQALKQVRLGAKKNKADLDAADIQAPADGVVVGLNVKEGESVSSNAIVVTIESDTGRVLRFLVPEAAPVPAGDQLLCLYSMDGLHTWKAAVTMSATTVDPNVHARVGEARLFENSKDVSDVPRIGTVILVGNTGAK